MATGKVLGAANNSSFSFSGGFRSIFFCCFATPTSTGSRAKDGENFKSKEFADETLGCEGKEGAGEKADTVAKDFGREEGQILTGGGGEGVYQIRRIRNSSEQDSTVYDEFGDSAIDTGSLNSQFNVIGSVDGETMRTGDNLDLADEDVIHHENHNDDIIISERYAAHGEQESNDDEDDNTQIRAATVPVFMTSVDSLEVRDGEGEGGDGGDGVTEADVDGATNLPVAEINVVAEAGVMEDATTAAIINADRAHPPVIQCGRVRMTFSYDVGRHRLTLTIHEASDIPEHDRVNLSHSQVHLLLLPATRKIRHRTKAKIGGNPKFEETYRVKIPTDELEGNGFRLRLYRSEKFKKERMIGENYVAFSSIGLPAFDQTTSAAYTTWITLLPRININIIGSPPSADGSVDLDIDNASETIANNSPSPSAAATLSSGHYSPMELMLGLAYNATTGRLSVEVVQGCNIRSPDSQKPPDTYVKLRQIAPNGKEITRCKTTLRRSQPNPHYKETFMFHVPQFQLPDVSLMVSVFERRNIKHNQMLGWFTLGHTNSTEETKKHWMAMIESKGEQIARWQLLLNP